MQIYAFYIQQNKKVKKNQRNSRYSDGINKMEEESFSTNPLRGKWKRTNFAAQKKQDRGIAQLV